MRTLINTLLFFALSIGIAHAQFNPADPAEPGNKYKLTLACSPLGAGELSGGGIYSKGEEVAIRAYAESGYEFKYWMNGDEKVSESSRFYFIMPAQATTLVAVFEKTGGNSNNENFNPEDPSEPSSPVVDDAVHHTLVVIAEPETGGTVNHLGETRLKEGETIRLEANPIRGYMIDGYYRDDELLSVRSSYYYTMADCNDTLTVGFVYSPTEPDEPGSTEKDCILITSQYEMERFSGIESFPRSVRIVGPEITSLEPLRNLTSVVGDLRIESTSLVSLDGLDNLVSVSGRIMIADNRMMTTLDGIVEWKGMNYVFIEGNSLLTDYCAMIDYASKPNANGVIRGNYFNPTFQEVANGKCYYIDPDKVKPCSTPTFEYDDKSTLRITAEY